MKPEIKLRELIGKKVYFAIYNELITETISNVDEYIHTGIIQDFTADCFKSPYYELRFIISNLNVDVIYVVEPLFVDEDREHLRELLLGDVFPQLKEEKDNIRVPKCGGNKGKQLTYIMYDSSTGYYKIGKSINPVYRERTLQSEKPTIDCLYVLDDDREDVLHRCYKKQRYRGEWFKLSKREVDNIVKLWGFHTYNYWKTNNKIKRYGNK